MSRCLVLVGAARSGTKLLRDLIAEHPAVDRVPYDVNYIWRLGNDSVPHDELGVELATPRVRARIRRHILNFSRGAPWLVEKTVSNTLRVDFVDAVFPFPDALYVHLVRDGRDVAESAARQWTAPPDWGAMLRKLPGFPLSMIGGYGMRYAAAALRRATGRDVVHAAPVWGPAHRDIQHDLTTRPLLDVCALQWQASVLRAFEAFDRKDPN
ncbi:MAG: sulfotransferase family protein, partial [Gemmatimonadaceae bacterium]